MNYNEYFVWTKDVDIPKTFVFETAFLGLHPDRLPLKMISLGKARQRVIKVPPRALNSYGRIVPVTEIGKNVFSGKRFITDIIMLPGILNISEEAFSGCTSLKRITIPKTIKVIRARTFDGCSSLENIYYEGSREDWNNIDIVSERYEIDFGENVPGTPVRTVIDERKVPIPGNEILINATVHFNCALRLAESKFLDETSRRDKTYSCELFDE